MKNTQKILVAFALMLTLLVSMATVTVFAAKTTSDTTIYLTPGDAWKSDDARFTIYTWDGGNRWFDMTDPDGDGVYECLIPAGIENLIFCRMNPSTSDNNWSEGVMWNQTIDIKYDGKSNNYTITDPWGESNGGKASGSWSVIETGECSHTPVGEGTVLGNATCTENGSISYVCSKCGETYTQAILATGHSYGAEGKCSCGAEVVYIIAGDVMQINSAYQSGDNSTIFGTSWDTANQANKMEYDAELGCFAKTYTNVAAGEYHFKVTADGVWYGKNGDTAGGSENCYINVAEDGMTVIITFKNGVPSATADHLLDPDNPNDDPVVAEKIYTVAGGVFGNEEAGFLGNRWDTTCADNDLVKGSDGIYTKTYTNVTAGEYEIKVVVDHAWNECYGEEGTANNYWFKVDEDGSTVTVSFDPATKLVTVTVELVAPEAPHEHNFVDGKCSCGESDPDYKPEDTKPEDTKPEDTKPEDNKTEDNKTEEPKAELTFMQKVILTIQKILERIISKISGFFAGLKK